MILSDSCQSQFGLNTTKVSRHNERGWRLSTFVSFDMLLPHLDFRSRHQSVLQPKFDKRTPTECLRKQDIEKKILPGNLSETGQQCLDKLQTEVKEFPQKKTGVLHPFHFAASTNQGWSVPTILGAQFRHTHLDKVIGKM